MPDHFLCTEIYLWSICKGNGPRERMGPPPAHSLATPGSSCAMFPAQNPQSGGNHLACIRAPSQGGASPDRTARGEIPAPEKAHVAKMGGIPGEMNKLSHLKTEIQFSLKSPGKILDSSKWWGKYWTIFRPVSPKQFFSAISPQYVEKMCKRAINCNCATFSFGVSFLIFGAVFPLKISE